MQKIYFRDPVLDKGLEEFLLSGFSYAINNQWFCFKETYDDPEFTLIQCHPARRSFLELVMIVNTYFPDVYSEKEIAETIHSLEGLYIMYCSDINKWVFMIDGTVSNKNIYNTTESNHQKQGIDDFSLQEYIDLLEKQ